MHLRLYSSPSCVPCAQLRADLAQAGIALAEVVDVTTADGMRLAAQHRVSQVPFVVALVDGHPVGFARSVPEVVRILDKENRKKDST